MVAYANDSEPDSDAVDGMPDKGIDYVDAQQSGPISQDSESQAVFQNANAVGHRVEATRSVLALVVDEECVFAGLQGGDIAVSPCLLTNVHEFVAH